MRQNSTYSIYQYVLWVSHVHWWSNWSSQAKVQLKSISIFLCLITNNYWILNLIKYQKQLFPNKYLNLRTIAVKCKVSLDLTQKQDEAFFISSGRSQTISKKPWYWGLALLFSDFLFWIKHCSIPLSLQNLPSLLSHPRWASWWWFQIVLDFWGIGSQLNGMNINEIRLTK